ncbi:MAG: hypothetical protein ABMA64_22090 [Myxococcota bacterium]
MSCTPRLPLLEAPIVGGTPQQRALAEREVELIAAAVGPDTVRLSAIEFGPMEGDDEALGGWYEDGEVRIDAELPTASVAYVVRHELCHAFDLQTGLADAPHPTLDAYVDRLFDPALGGIDPYGDARARRSEAVARICEVGPLVARALASPCPEDPPLTTSLAAFALTWIWSGLPTGPEVRLGVPIFADGFVGPYRDLWFEPTTDPGRILLTTHDELHETAFHHFELDSGVEVEFDPDLETTTLSTGGIEVGPGFERTLPFRAAGVPGASLLAALTNLRGFAVGSAEFPEERLFWSDSAGSAPVPVCLPGVPVHGITDPTLWNIFPADGELWYGEGDGERAWWFAVSAAP